MKVLVASHTYIVDLNCEKLRALAQLRPDVEVTVVVPKRWSPGGVQNRVIEPEPREEGRFRIVPIANFSQNNQGLLSFGLEIVDLLRRFRPDIIQVEQGAKALGYAELITLNRLLGLRAKKVFFTWWNLPYQLKFPVSLLEAYNLRHTDGLLVGNQDGADILRDRGYLGPTCIMPQLGVDERLFRPQPQPQLAAQHGIEPDDWVIGFVGRFVPEKGLRTLLTALTQLQDKRWKLLLLGRGPLRQELAQEAEAAGIGDRICWVESVPHDDVPRYINLMQTLVLPSETTYNFKTLTAAGWKEQFGHVLIEAMACRVPVIGSDSGEIPHVIGEAGLVFPEGQPDALAACLSQLMEQPARHEALAQQGYDRAMTQYTNRALAKRQLEFYEKLIA
ncbi:glycosyltransferase family 4 protein [Romeria aff. gracilis LEGE 07310]|uniref:Glycosyltransferase family 4 protein n=1 Tax=Vasconcelosia minhoensis LEGE 07310 TaxID=915328 RepID=A0A8J7DCP7_9CYAN|nr:hormogonium polysaccharide biosynthesis glycosyltransferase HpsO [Romeria gracilis]MBE9079117.1 glycosyltransferase family 4 protein [Romeria aff. gracilis LEGE 07310]